MFIEPYRLGKRKGWLEVICGSMFSGKTEELIRRLRRVEIAGMKAELFKPSIDVRYHPEDVVSHNNTRVRSTVVDSSASIALMIEDGIDVVAIDEVQFFDDGLIDTVDLLLRKEIRLIVAGLDMDYTGKPFGPMPALMAKAEYITKLHAICMQCGDIATYSYRKQALPGQVLLGQTELYEPRCRSCFYASNK